MAKRYPLTIFYDGHCPLCSFEMQKLKMHDKENLIVLVDLHHENFQKNHPHINTDKAMRILHGQYKNNILLGLDVTHRAWTIVGKGIWVAPLQFPVIKQCAHLVYLLLAKYRHPISHFLHKYFAIGTNVCDKGTCYGKANNTNYRS